MHFFAGQSHDMLTSKYSQWEMANHIVAVYTVMKFSGKLLVLHKVDVDANQQAGDRAFAAACPELWNSLPPHPWDACLSYSLFQYYQIFLYELWGHSTYELF